MWWEQKDMSTMKTPRLKTVTPETEPFAKCQRCHNSEADLMTLREKRFAKTALHRLKYPNGNAA
jgi:hypothetical protein